MRLSVLRLAVIGLVLVAFAMGRAAVLSEDTMSQLRAAFTAACAIMAVIGIVRSQPWARFFVALTSVAIWTGMFYPAPPAEDVSPGWRIGVGVLITLLLFLINVDVWQRLGRLGSRSRSGM